MLVISAIRELIAYGTFCGRVVDADIVISGLGLPFGGFIILGIACGIYRCIAPNSKDTDDFGGDSDVYNF